MHFDVFYFWMIVTNYTRRGLNQIKIIGHIENDILKTDLEVQS